ncbi:ORF6N domain-containing protein [Spirosoma harenae]
MTDKPTANLLPEETLFRKIHRIRERKVLLDVDLAELYGVEVRVLKQAVRRNIERFPIDFMFELSSEEWQSLRSQFVILNDPNSNLEPSTKASKRGQHAKYAPFVFTEQGVAMLSSVLPVNEQ